MVSIKQKLLTFKCAIPKKDKTVFFGQTFIISFKGR